MLSCSDSPQDIRRQQARSGTVRFQDRADSSTVKIYGRYRATIIGGSKERASTKAVRTMTSAAPTRCGASVNAAVTAASDLHACRLSICGMLARPQILPRQ